MPNPGDPARRALIEKEKTKQLAVINEFKKIQNRLSLQIYDTLKQIDHLQRTEGNAPVNLLIKKARFSMLLDQVSDEIKKASDRLAQITESSQSSAIAVAKTQAGKSAQLRTDLTFFDSAATQELIGIAGNGEPLDVVFSRLAPRVKQAMFDALFYGIATGRPNAVIAKEVRDAIGGGAFGAMTIVRTETNRAYREATRKFYDQTDGVIGWKWIAALDLRTCPICWALHGHIFETSVKFGTHPNCRCTLIAVFKGDKMKDTGSDEFAKLNRAQQLAILGPRRLELYELGADLTDFVETHQTPFGLGRRLTPLVNVDFTAKPRTPAPAPFAGSIGTRSTTTPEPASPALGNTAAAAVTEFALGDPVPDFVSGADAMDYFGRRYPDMKFDFNRIDVDILNQTTKEMARLFDEYPEVTARMKYVGTYADKKIQPGTFDRGEFAHATHPDLGPKNIGLNPYYFENAKLYKETKERSYVVGHLVSPKIDATFTHEFGHAIDGYLTRTIGRDTVVPVSYADGKNISVGAIKNAILRKYKPKRGEISDYATQDKFERFAEAFSQFHNTDQRSNLAVNLEKFIRWLQGRRTFPKAEQKDWFEMTDAEKTAIRKEINDIYEQFGLSKPFKKSEL
jgi:SPP1 gp7 family putative phage head morphogenesis protein